MMHFAGRTIVLACVLVGATPCVLSQDHNVIYVEDYAGCATAPCGTQSNPWTSASGTGGIEEALADCDNPVSGTPGSGCVLMLPKGYVSITSTIDRKSVV